MYLRIAVVLTAIGGLAGLLFVTLGGSIANSPTSSEVQNQLVDVQSRLDADAQALRAMVQEAPDRPVLAQVVFEDLSDVRDVAEDLSGRGLEIRGLTGVLEAGGQNHVGHFQVPEGTSPADLPRLYALEQSRFVEGLAEDFAGRLDCDPLAVPALSDLSPPTTVREVPDGEFPCAPENVRPSIEATLIDLERLMDQVQLQGFPVFAVEVRGLPADVVTLLGVRAVRSVALPDESGRLPSPFQLDLPRTEGVR